MSIKSDNWIRRMAEQHKMIEPYEAEQVRYNGEQRVISYGVSSYGYDVRCANEFKIFTNVHSKTVDPKNFDDDSFVTGIQYLINQGIMHIPETTQGSSASSEIPGWIKNNAAWWAKNMIDDSSFVSGIQWLITNGIMKIS